ncbi:uncharacterized protein EV154DRAFT_519072 [Mucor mucedo]|uniref:uncharacterized protein n=1 Tax=Mucor mucedo TaxID=29922 RepID=UPI00221F15A3|nr:uncharacterized protein EV154DRAFT_519072 [Mucor mucedo]KAI7888048.1 hypothetical protein EV154DRAFT_519072 [Mucor mucedo]
MPQAARRPKTKPKFDAASNLKIDQFFKPLPKMKTFIQENENSQDRPSSFGNPTKGRVNENNANIFDVKRSSSNLISSSQNSAVGLKRTSSNLVSSSQNSALGLKRTSSNLTNSSQNGTNPFGIKRNPSDLMFSSQPEPGSFKNTSSHPITNIDNFFGNKSKTNNNQRLSNPFEIKRTASNSTNQSDTDATNNLKRTSSNSSGQKKAQGVLDTFLERKEEPVRVFVDENEGCETRPRSLDARVVQARALQKKKIKPLNTYSPTTTSPSTIFRDDYEDDDDDDDDEENNPPLAIYRDDLNTQYIMSSSLVRPDELVDTGPQKKFQIYVDKDTQQSSPLLSYSPDSQVVADDDDDGLSEVFENEKKSTPSPLISHEVSSYPFNDDELLFSDNDDEDGFDPADEFSIAVQDVNEPTKPEKSLFED